MAVLIGVCCCWFLLYFFSFNFFFEFILFLFAALRARCVPVRDALQARTKCSACCDANWRPKARAMNGNGTRLLSPYRWCCWRCRCCCCCLGHGAGKQFVSFPRCSCGAKFYAEFWWESVSESVWEMRQSERIWVWVHAMGCNVTVNCRHRCCCCCCRCWWCWFCAACWSPTQKEYPSYANWGSMCHIKKYLIRVKNLAFLLPT